ncbi:hypothetical protein DHEL01_v206630 [Diaporthe helianthi]|uniref:Threonine/serine exporter-like N-terminal domain-containing protein n=1 Tax=Diaporthe helianthi TaxID=158607 RepID=A0A2P5HXK0_DIAHE|nr:hypothetical protein DHEL01_v206630 [Diaporthe helianthi]
MSSNTSPSRPASPARDGQPSASQAYRNQLSPIITVTTAREKKKKVGWVGNPEDRSPPEEVDYFSHVPVSDSHNSTPGVPDAAITSPARRDSFDKEEITNALERILKPEDHAGPQKPTMTLPHLRLPKPVLRKHNYPDNPSEPVEGLSHPSEIEARHRAGRLAESVSGVVSRASPDDSPVTENFDNVGLLNRTDTHDHAAATGAVKPDENLDQSGLKFRQKVEADADRLIRSHTKRRAMRSTPMAFAQTQQEPDDIRSGTATPVAYDLEFVPPAPTKYHGGILGTLLKLYNQDDRTHSGEGSATTTPSRTPNRTPRGSPPGTAPGTPRPERPRNGLFGLGARHSASTLAELIGSSSTLAAPATSNKDWSEIVTDKLKRERTEREQRTKKEHKRKSSKTPQQKLEQLQIKKHIAEIISRHKYLVKLCRALMEFGAPTHRLEAYMAMSARVLAIEGQFLYLPSCMIISFDDTHTHTTEVKMVRVPQGVDLGKLRDVHEIYKLVVHDLMGVDEAMSRLDAVVTRKHKFNKWIRVLTYGLAAVCVAPFAFQGSWIDMPIAFVMGCIVGLMQLIAAPSSELYANVFETSAALLMSFLGRMFGSIQYKGEHLFCFSALSQASIALILPGYMVLCGSLELQSHNMIAGSVRMVYAMIYTLFLGYGITIGAVLYGLMDKNAVSSTTCPKPLNSYWNLLFVPLFTLCLCVINQAKYKQLPVMVTISFAGYVVNSYTNKYLDSSTISNTLGALTIGLLANLYSRLSRPAENLWLKLKLRKVKQDLEKGMEKANEDPEATARKVGYGLAAAAMLPAIFVQVPSGLASGGSLVSGVTSANAITGNKSAAASTMGASDLNTGAFTVLLSVIQVAISISVGLGLAALLVYPFGKRRSGLFSF